MAYTMTLVALPTSYGSTAIQANAILQQLNDYSVLSTDVLEQIIADSGGRGRFRDMPGKGEYPLWQFYTRGDMSGTDSDKATIIAVRKISEKLSFTVQKTSTDVAQFDDTVIYTYVRSWHCVKKTWSDGTMFLRWNYSSVVGTMHQDLEQRVLALPTNGYQAIHESMGFLLKPVAAGAPTETPWFKAIGGGNPNTV